MSAMGWIADKLTVWSVSDREDRGASMPSKKVAASISIAGGVILLSLAVWRHLGTAQPDIVQGVAIGGLGLAFVIAGLVRLAPLR
jgi:hypothetical protein